MSVDISFLDFNVPVKDAQGGVYVSMVDFDLNDSFALISDPFYGDSPYMATNPYFNNYDADNEKSLLDDLVVESIQIHGQDMYYIPRKLNNKDEIYHSDNTATYEKAYFIEFYIKSYDGFGGGGSMITQHGGYEIRNTIVLMLSKSRFDVDIGQYESLLRPREGDLVYFPLNQKCFEIKYVENKPQFYPLGSLPTYDLHCELFEYSSQRFSTGIPEIDKIQTDHSMDALDYAIFDEDGNILVDEANNVITTEKYIPDTIDKLTDNEEIQRDANSFIDWTEYDPFSGGKY